MTTPNTGIASMVEITPMSTMPLWRQTILLHGEPKIGKTTECKKFKNAIYLDAEQGTIGIDVPTFENLLPGRDRFNSPICMWEDVIAATQQLALARGKGIEGTIIIDTAQVAFDMCRSYVLERKLHISHETDLGYGKGWRSVKDEFSAWITEIKSIGFGIVFVSHTKEIEIEKPTAKYTKKVPKLDTGPNDIILPFVNFILYAEIQHIGGRDFRVMHTKGTSEISAGERGENPRLQALLPFDFDCLQRNYNGEQIDLNSHFGFSASAPPTPPMVEPPQPCDSAASRQLSKNVEPLPDGRIVETIAKEFDAFEV